MKSSPPACASSSTRPICLKPRSEQERRSIVAYAAETLAGSISMAHAKDRDAAGGFVAAGTGVIDFPHFLACLRQSGFDGPLVAHGLSEAEAPAVSALLAKAMRA